MELLAHNSILAEALCYKHRLLNSNRFNVIRLRFESVILQAICSIFRDSIRNSTFERKSILLKFINLILLQVSFEAKFMYISHLTRITLIIFYAVYLLQKYMKREREIQVIYSIKWSAPFA